MKGDRIAVTGPNGAGKSTLLKIIAGIESHDSGRLIKEKVSCDYIAQEFAGDSSLSVLEYLDAVQATSNVFAIIKRFGVITDDQLENSYVHELSGGQQRVLEITSVLSRSPMFLCIDEPENHLDIKTRMVLVKLLQEYWGAVLVVSHDRYLVNEIASKILQLQDQKTTLMSGVTYEEFMQTERQNRSSALADWKAESRALNKLTETVRMLKARTRYNDAQAKTYQMKKRQLAERQQELGRRPDREQTVQIEVGAVRQKTGKRIFGCTDVQFHFPEQPPILKHINLELRFGDRVVLFGRNGTGKSTFLRLLKQELVPQVGQVTVGIETNIQHISQTDTLDGDKSLLEHLYEYNYTQQQARSLLAQFLFTQSEATVALKTLSRGQQQRFMFLLLFKHNPECIVLDEPTNNLDPDTWDLLLQLITEYTGSLLLVSHDRYFIEQLSDLKQWVLKKGVIKESWASLDAILERL